MTSQNNYIFLKCTRKISENHRKTNIFQAIHFDICGVENDVAEFENYIKLVFTLTKLNKQLKVNIKLQTMIIM